MHQYLDLLEEVLEEGDEKGDRTGTGTLSVFGRQMHFDLRNGFPLVTTKKVFWRGVVEELLWFLSGDTKVSSLRDKGVNIWNEWELPDGTIGPGGYGAMWREWKTTDGQVIDQIARVIDSIKNNPDSRRHIVTAWNPELVPETALPPCHSLFQFHVSNGRLSCHLFQRSGDLFLGIPFNIASYSLLTHMVAHLTDLEVGEFIHTISDAHIYLNHLEQARDQLSRSPRPLPTLKINRRVKSIDDFKYEDFTLEGYDPYPAIKAPVAV